MGWNICLHEHIKKIEPDNEKIESIRKMCRVRLRVVGQVAIDDETASVVAEDYYEIIKELLVALLLKNGLKSDNHECLISFFKNSFYKYEFEARTIHQLKDVRNRVSYDGIFVKKEYITSNKLEFEHIIQLLDNLLGSCNFDMPETAMCTPRDLARCKQAVSEHAQKPPTARSTFQRGVFDNKQIKSEIKPNQKNN